MIWERKALIGGGIALAIILCIAGVEAYETHRALTQSEKNQESIRESEAAKDAAIKSRDQAASDQIKAISQMVASIKTAGQAVQVIRVASDAPRVAGQPAPPAQTVEVQKNDFTPEAQAKLPDSPSSEYVLQTQEGAVATAKTLLQCQADKVTANACKLDLADRTTQYQLAQRDAKMWEDTAKGGSVWHRTLKIAGCIAVAGGGAAGGAYFKGPVGAAIGGGAAGGLCNIVWK